MVTVSLGIYVPLAKSWTITDYFDTPPIFKGIGVREGESFSLPLSTGRKHPSF